MTKIKMTIDGLEMRSDAGLTVLEAAGSELRYHSLSEPCLQCRRLSFVW